MSQSGWLSTGSATGPAQVGAAVTGTATNVGYGPSQIAMPISGSVTISNGTVSISGTVPVSIASMPTTPVTGTFWQTTQPVSIAATVTTAESRLPTALNADGGLPIHVQNFPATQPISAASLPLPAGAAQDGTDITTPTAMPAGGAGIRGWLSAIWTKLNGTLATTVGNFPATQAVTGTFFQATQPVSGTVNTGLSQPLTDTQLRASAVPVTGSGTAGTPAAGVQTVQGITGGTPQNAALTPGTATIGHLNELRAATAVATATGASGAAVTATIPAGGAGLFTYITSIEITAYSAAARTGSATPWLVTTTNITGAPAYTFSTGAAIGTTDQQRPIMATPLKTAAANAATTVVAPAATGVIWRINVSYFYAP